ncbi:DUF6048 family protein [Membranihabitans maritimus]|uniref:DUF6048 family protein n=1 Tax=Membranihabitans maritimus TaxID=2904244 RepID=UPI001F27A565|nr:DUF6048 family protein [Membranihabitans maritimus]
MKIYVFFTSVFIYLLSSWTSTVFSQIVDTSSVYIGLDASKIALPFFQPERRAMEISVEAKVKPRIYGVLEGGIDRFQQSEDLFKYSSGGFYTRLGFNYNFAKSEEEGRNELVYAGMRLGSAFFRQQLESLNIPEFYWERFSGTYEKEALSGYWLEAVGGLRAPLIKNIHIGWTLRIKFPIAKPQSETINPYHLPGYGSLIDGGILGMSYSLYYNFPVSF